MTNHIKSITPVILYCDCGCKFVRITFSDGDTVVMREQDWPKVFYCEIRLKKDDNE